MQQKIYYNGTDLELFVLQSSFCVFVHLIHHIDSHFSIIIYIRNHIMHVMVRSGNLSFSMMGTLQMQDVLYSKETLSYIDGIGPIQFQQGSNFALLLANEVK